MASDIGKNIRKPDWQNVLQVLIASLRDSEWRALISSLALVTVDIDYILDKVVSAKIQKQEWKFQSNSAKLVERVGQYGQHWTIWTILDSMDKIGQ